LRNVLALVALCVAMVSAPAFAQKSSSKKSSTKTAALKTSKDSISYAIGVQIGKNLMQQQDVSVDPEMLTRAIFDVLGNKPTALTDEQIQGLFKSLQERLAQSEMAKIQESAGENKRAGEQFLAENGRRPGVVTLPSGLQYEVITAGPDGAKPKSTDKVTAHYKGTLLDGTTFDSSYDRGEPTGFQLDQVIPGWTEALQLMTVGSKWRLFIPSNLAYGEGGAPGSPIGPNSTLVFEVELLKIN
jgi:FKBP-type peptidyl-prolyl cis-trans isomerase